uniref:Uncharacterized protein n=1 Tax=Mycena chlorophos TaxID=658473 RepID=A0ABQ0LS83_MYCCL|nr:predicted protein [Mycena chlorophos]
MLQVFEKTLATLALPGTPPLRCLALYLTSFDEEDAECTTRSLSAAGHRTGPDPRVCRSRASGTSPLCVAPSHEDSPNLTYGGPYSGEPFNAIFAACAKFHSLESLVLHLRAEGSFDFFDWEPTYPEREYLGSDEEEEERRSYLLGYPHEEFRIMLGDPEASGSRKNTKSGLNEEKEIPDDERDFGCEIMTACPTLLRLDLGVETYAGSSEGNGPRAYKFTRSEGERVVVEKYPRQTWRHWGWEPSDDFVKYIAEG